MKHDALAESDQISSVQTRAKPSRPLHRSSKKDVVLPGRKTAIVIGDIQDQNGTQRTSVNVSSS